VPLAVPVATASWDRPCRHSRGRPAAQLLHRKRTGLRAPGYVRCGAPADKDDHDVHPQCTTFQTLVAVRQICSAHKYDIAY
jgi:hypothetical protein